VDIDAADAVCVPEYGDAGVIFDVADELIRSARDTEVDVFV